MISLGMITSYQIVYVCVCVCVCVSPLLEAPLGPLGHCQNVASLSFLYSYYFGRCSSELDEQVLLAHSRGSSSGYSNSLHDFSVSISGCYKDVYVSRFFARTPRP